MVRRRPRAYLVAQFADRHFQFHYVLVHSTIGQEKINEQHTFFRIDNLLVFIQISSSFSPRIGVSCLLVEGRPTV